MAGKGDIKAGRAYVELLLKDGAFTKGLRNAGNKLKDFGSATAAIGASITAAWASIVGPLLAAVNHFSEVGSALADMSARTGVSAGALAELGYAAEQTGASMEDVEKAIANMAKKGNKKSFDEQAAAIAKIADPAKQAKAAFEAWGKSGIKLIPMIENMQELRQEARDLGLVPTDAAVAAADAVGDAFDRTKKAAGAVVFQIGAALAGAVTKAANTITRIVVSINKWVQQNQALVVTVAKIGLALMAAGAAIAAVGTAIAGLGFIFTGIAAAVATLGTVLGVLLSPLGLITAALVAGAVVWAKYTASGQAAVAGVMGFLGQFAETFQKTFGGIADAIQAGDLELAGRIAMAGLKVALLQGVAAIANAVGGQFGDFLGTIGQQIVSGDLSGAWATTLAGMQDMWAQFSEGMVAIFTGAMRAVTDAWQATTSAISDWILKNASEGGILGGLALAGTGVDMQAEQERSNKLNAQAKRMGLAQGPDALTTAQGAARDILGGQADAFRAKLDALDRSAQAKSNAAGQNFRQRTAGGASGATAAADAAMGELDSLRGRAAAAAAAVAAQDAAAANPALDAAASFSGAKAQQSIVTSSAAGLAAMGGGMGAADRTARASEDMLRELRMLRKENEKLREEVKAGGLLTA